MKRYLLPAALHRVPPSGLLQLVLLLALLLGVAWPAQAQVVIKERVEIKKQETLSKRQDSPSNTRRGPLKSDWATPYLIQSGPPDTAIVVGNAVTRTGYLNVAYAVADWLNVPFDGEIHVEVHRDSLLRTVVDTFAIDENFDQQTLVDAVRCKGFGGPDIDYQLPTFSNRHLFDPFIFQKDSVEIAPDFTLFDAGRLFPGDTVIVSFVTNTGEYANQKGGTFSSAFEYTRLFNECQIDESLFQYQSMELTAYFEWTVDHFDVFDGLLGTPLAQNDSARISIRPMHEDGLTVAPFDPEQMVRMELNDEGARLGYLKGPDGTIAASLDLPFREANGNVFYFANDSDPSVILSPLPVKITVTKIDDELITGDVDFHVGGHTFEIVVVPDTVDFGETGQVTITAIDKTDSTLVSLPNSTPLIIIASNNTLITPDSSTVAPFIVLPYGEARSGQLQVKVTNPFLPLFEPNIRDASLFTYYFYQDSVLIGGQGKFIQRYAPMIELEFDRDPDTYSNAPSKTSLPAIRWMNLCQRSYTSQWLRGRALCRTWQSLMAPI